MKKLVGLFAVLMFVCVILSASPVSAGIPFCWFNKYVDGIQAPTTITVSRETPVQLDISITVSPTGVWATRILTDVVVKDRFGAEWEIVGSPIASKGSWTIQTKGRSEKVFLTWEVGTLNPGETATLDLVISTDLNPAGHQEYTSPGCYELNSGAVLKFKYLGKQYSAYTLPIEVTVT